MIAQRLAITDVLLLVPKVYPDDRGAFFESFNEKVFRELTGADCRFVQDNHSRSVHNVLRGLHYQLPPKAQGKLVRVTHGEIFDVAVDMRRDSPTFGRWVSTILSASNHHQLWIPPGFAHGFQVLSDYADAVYKLTDYYAPDCERCVRWDDPDLAIDWPSKTPVLSPRDRAGSPFVQSDTFPGHLMQLQSVP